ncbi:NAD(P)H-dependent oxidoreductase [Candidatus Woesearchaeota archaeon]|nr:NAD(P)H-dependent oxidoreductase [Candidatus Woesearchaeota archaeon]
MTIVDDLQWRYATKKFDPAKKIPGKDWKELEEVLRLSPSSYGLQPWKFLVVKSKELRQELKKVSHNQDQVTDASHFVVFSVPQKVNAELAEKHIRNIVKIRDVSLESLEGYKKRILESMQRKDQKTLSEWAQRQTYIALGMLMMAAAVKRIDACPMEGIEKESFDKILNLQKEGLITVVACALGYRSADDSYAQRPKVRFEKKDVILEI